MVKSRNQKTTKEKILISAKKVFIEKGMYGARMQDIADEAGINKAMLHYYFSSKDKLFEVIFLEAAQKLFPRINTIIESDAPFFEKIEKFCDEYITIMSENPYLPMFVLNELSRNADKFLNTTWGKHRLPRPQKFLEQVEKEVKKRSIKRISPVQLLMNLISLTIFPFVGKAMFQFNMNLDELQYRMIMEQRKKEIPKFIIDSIKK
jgi:TetR/AcrR family transcriptional regulator